MGMMQNIQLFRQEAQRLIDSGTTQPGRDILALALNPPGGPAHPGAYPHIVLEMLEVAQDLPLRDKLKAALAEFPSSPAKAMNQVYSRS